MLIQLSLQQVILDGLLVIPLLFTGLSLEVQLQSCLRENLLGLLILEHFGELLLSMDVIASMLLQQL